MEKKKRQIHEPKNTNFTPTVARANSTRKSLEKRTEKAEFPKSVDKRKEKCCPLVVLKIIQNRMCC